MDMKPVLAILPPKLRESTEGLRTGALEELRLRAGRPPTAVLTERSAYFRAARRR